MAIVCVEVGPHSQQNLVHPFSGLGFRDEQFFADAAYSLNRFPLLDLFKKLKSSSSDRFAHGDKFAKGRNTIATLPDPGHLSLKQRGFKFRTPLHACCAESAALALSAFMLLPLLALGVLTANMGCKLLVALQLEVAHHLIE